MRKHVIALSLALLAFSVFAVGPKIPYRVTWTPSPVTPTNGPATGYFFYWKSTNAGSAYNDVQRFPLATNSQPWDARVLGLPRGTYWVMMTGTNSNGESDPSADFLWEYNNPAKPSNIDINPP